MAVVAYVTNGMPWRIAAQLDIAKHDGTMPALENCLDTKEQHAANMDKIKNNIFCELGSKTTGAVDFVVMGDSHAMAFAPMFHLLADTGHLRGQIFSCLGTPPFLGKARAKDGREPYCRSYFDAAYAHVKADSPRYVFWVGRWTAYLYGETNATYQQGMLATDGSDAVPAAVLHKAIEQTIMSLPVSTKFVIFAQPPEYTVDVYHERMAVALAARNPQDIPALTDSDEKLFMSRDTQNKRVALLREALDGFGSKIKIIDVSDVFCDEKRCHFMAGSTSLYNDSNHITGEGAEYLFKKLEPQLLQLPAIIE